MKQEHPPLTWARFEQLAAAGMGAGDFEYVNPPKARQLIASAREHFAGQCEVIEDQEQLRSALIAANATLERVRAEVKAWRTAEPAKEGYNYLLRIERALASGSASETRSVPSQPETPKEPAGDPTLAGPALLLRDLAAANAKIAELEASNDCFMLSSEQSLKDAKAAEDARDAANARADAAERAEKQAYAREDTALQEGKRLAARVTELENACAFLGRCTPEERQVLAACGKAEIVEVKGLGCHVGLGEANRKLAEAELANRAAKAKRGDK